MKSTNYLSPTVRWRLLIPTFVYLVVCPGLARAEVLIVADEFPAMQVLAKKLLTEEKISSRTVAQAEMPKQLDRFTAVVVYIHGALAETAEQAFIQYARGGGRLVLLHHSISSGKRKNPDWFGFLGVDLPTGELAQGGYKWIEDVTVEWMALTNHYIMTNQVTYPERAKFLRTGEVASQALPAFTLNGTEVYLNHVLRGPRTLLMGLSYRDGPTNQYWQ